MLGGFLATWGPIIGFVGGLIGVIGGGLSLLDRYRSPNAEIHELIPVYISEPKVIAGANSAIRGVGIVLHIRATNRAISITGLELTGKRCLSFDEFIGFLEADGKSLQELEAQFDRQRPFQLVSFYGWPTDRSGPVLLTPWEESYIRFTFLEPDTGAIPGLVIDHRYLGSRERGSPLIRRYGFNVGEMFTVAPSNTTSWTAGHLRNEILDGALTYKVLTGGSQIVVPPPIIRPPKRLAPEAWKKGGLGTFVGRAVAELGGRTDTKPVYKLLSAKGKVAGWQPTDEANRQKNQNNLTLRMNRVTL